MTFPGAIAMMSYHHPRQQMIVFLVDGSFHEIVDLDRRTNPSTLTFKFDPASKSSEGLNFSSENANECRAASDRTIVAPQYP